MTKETKPRTDTWDDFAGDYLKADLIDEFPCELVVKGIEAGYDDARARLIIEVEYHAKTWKIDLNKTNQNVLRFNGIKAPKDIIGRKLIFQKIKQRNPTTNTMVDSLIIEKVE